MPTMQERLYSFTTIFAVVCLHLQMFCSSMLCHVWIVKDQTHPVLDLHRLHEFLPRLVARGVYISWKTEGRSTESHICLWQYFDLAGTVAEIHFQLPKFWVSFENFSWSFLYSRSTRFATEMQKSYYEFWSFRGRVSGKEGMYRRWFFL